MTHSLVHLALIWGAVYIAVVCANKTKLTPVLFFLFFGSVMVNTGLLPVDTEPFIRGLSEIGIIIIMFAIGFEENSSNFIQSVRKSWGIAFFGALGPFLVAYSIAIFFWEDRNLALMFALTMTATAVSLTMVSLKSEGLETSLVATRVMTSAVLDDIASLALVAILIPVATGAAEISVLSVMTIVGKAILFFLIISVAGIWIFPHNNQGMMSKVPILGQYGVKHLLDFEGGRYATLTILLLALTTGLLAHYFGFHPAVGAYMAGLVLKEEYFDVRGKTLSSSSSYQETKRIIDNAAFCWIGPIFFVDLGAKIVFDWNIFVSVIPQTLSLFLGIFVIQISSAALAARYTGGMDWASSMMVGFGMLGRAELAFVVMNIAYVQNQILSTEAFYTLMFAAFWLNVTVPICISLWKPIYLARTAR